MLVETLELSSPSAGGEGESETNGRMAQQETKESYTVDVLFLPCNNGQAWT